jgi:hypothetical protein
VTVVEPHQVWRFALVAMHLDDLAMLIRVPDDVSVDTDPVADSSLHAWASLHAEVSY